MSNTLFAYLNPEAVQFPKGEQVVNVAGTNVYCGIHPSIQVKGDPLVPMTVQIPAELEQHIVMFSIYDTFPGGSERIERECGTYTYRSAIATITRDEKRKHEFRVYGKALEDTLELFRRVKVGDILPDKGQSFERGQEDRLVRFPTFRDQKEKLIRTAQEILDLIKRAFLVYVERNG